MGVVQGCVYICESRVSQKKKFFFCRTILTIDDVFRIKRHIQNRNVSILIVVRSTSRACNVTPAPRTRLGRDPQYLWHHQVRWCRAQVRRRGHQEEVLLGEPTRRPLRIDGEEINLCFDNIISKGDPRASLVRYIVRLPGVQRAPDGFRLRFVVIGSIWPNT